jgi:pyruvate/2-oxoglutarate dehydrogenase complex dihydrolipoamide acyltransferase (E2) component
MKDQKVIACFIVRHSSFVIPTMPRIPIIMPQLGESIAEATVVRIPFQVGASIECDQDVLEVETNKATMGVTAPCAGRVAEWLVEEQHSYPVGSTLGWLEVSEADAASFGVAAAPAHFHESERAEHAAQAVSPSAKRTVQPTVRGLPVPAHAAGASYLSPRLKARMNELGMHAADLAGIPGSGAAGRVTIDDFEKFVARLEEQKLTDASPMRVAVADAMRRAWTRPLATVGMSVVLGPMLAHRKAADPKPGPALYALRALALALCQNSAPAGRLVGGKIVHPKAIDIGFAVEADDGVLVPVIRNADQAPLPELVARYNELVELARQRRLPGAAQGGSIATVTNFGTFGLEWATPIPLPEQTLVLGLGAGRVVPSWDKTAQKFLPVVEAQLTLSFDHRVLDGGGAGRLLQSVASLLQEPGKL